MAGRNNIRKHGNSPQKRKRSPSPPNTNLSKLTYPQQPEPSPFFFSLNNSNTTTNKRKRSPSPPPRSNSFRKFDPYIQPQNNNNNRSNLIQNVFNNVNSKKKKKRSPSPPRSNSKQRLEYPGTKELLSLSFNNAHKQSYKRSTLLITITTNKTCFAIANETNFTNFKSRLEAWIRGFVIDKDNWVAKLNTEDYGKISVYFEDAYHNETLKGVIDSITIDELAWEEGKKFNRLHCHIMATCKYIMFNGYFHLNREDLFNGIRSNLPYINWYGRLPYINLRYIKNAVDSVADYIKKLHDAEHFESLAKRTLDRINEYKEIQEIED